MGVKYRKEFFDREYTAREAYSRTWQYAKKYKFRIFVGVICGMLTAGTLLPIFSVVQPALEKVSHNEKVEAFKSEFAVEQSAIDEAKAAGMPSWYPKAKKLADKFGIPLEDEEGAMGGALVLMAVVGIPLVAFLRLLFVFLNQYCLTWAATRVVADLRTDLLKKVQEQSLEFHGRVDVGQLMSRATTDPQIMQTVIHRMLEELCRAPFEILVSVGFIIWFAIENHMMPTLGVIVIGMPAFMLPVIGLGKLIRKWSRRTLEKNGAYLG